MKLATIQGELARLIGDVAVLPGDRREYLRDATESAGIEGRADAIALPSNAGQVAAVVRWCADRSVPITPRGGGTGYAGGAVPDGGVVLATERLARVRGFEPQSWRMHVDAGLTTGNVRRLARDSGLMYPPDPGSVEQCQIGGNIATNAGGPHTLKYRSTRAWVTGLEVVLPSGELAQFGGPLGKDVAGYDLVSLLTGSEGTLGVITAAWLRLLPAPETEQLVVAALRDSGALQQAVTDILGSGIEVAAIEFLDGRAASLAGRDFPHATLPTGCPLLLAAADGSASEAERLRDAVVEVVSPLALSVETVTERRSVAELWRWREGVSLRVAASQGGKLSEDIVVPLERLAEAVERIPEIGDRHGLTGLSWGHAGDGNIHATFLLDPTQPEQRDRAQRAAQDVFALALELGGSVTGEHGLGTLKQGWLNRQWGAAAYGAHDAVKAALDPAGVMNPGKKR